MRRVADGLWWWTGPHPEWHPRVFGAVVGSYALQAGDELLLVDPLVGDEGAALDKLAAEAAAVHVLVTIGYHVRSASELARRYDARIWGPPQVGSRLKDRRAFTDLEPGEPGPGGAVAYAIGKPRRGERPLWLPSHKAIAFGDALVSTPDGELRMWTHEPVDERVRRFYAERFAPTLQPLAELPARRILTTHGEPVRTNGAARLAEALAAEPWYHHA